MRFSAHRVEAVALSYPMLCYAILPWLHRVEHTILEVRARARRDASPLSLLGADSITDFDVFVPLEGCY